MEDEKMRTINYFVQLIPPRNMHPGNVMNRQKKTFPSKKAWFLYVLPAIKFPA